MEWMKLNCHSYMFYTPKTQNGMDETQVPFELKVSFIHVLHPEKLNFPWNLKCHSYIFCTPKTENGMYETQLFFELKVSFIHVLHPENSKWNGWNSTSLRTQSVTPTSCTPWKLKMEWTKLNFPSNLKCHSYIFCTPKTENGMYETQLFFELKVSFIHVLHRKTQNGMDETQLPFELKVSFLHLVHPENSRWNGWNSTSLRS